MNPAKMRERRTRRAEADGEEEECRACVDMGALLAEAGAQDTRQESVRDTRLYGDCPPDSSVLGRATWTFLHSVAAYYPLSASASDQQAVSALLELVARLYPCTHCASDFSVQMAAHPPQTQGRLALSRWLCLQHNIVNDKLGKPRFDCARVLERWRTGPNDGRCG